MGSRATHAPGPEDFRLPRHFYSYAALAGLVLFYLYVWLRIEPNIEYQHSAPVFILAGSFFSPFLKYPGGLLDYAAAFLAQLDYYGWLGAIVYTALAGLLWFLARGLLRTTRVGVNLAPFMMGFLLLLVREQYDGLALKLSLGLSIALAGASVSRAIPRILLRVFATWAIGLLVLFSAGVWPFLVLLLVVGLGEARQQRFRWAALLWAMPVLAAGVIWVRWADFGSWFRLNPGCQGAMAWLTACLLYGIVPVALLIPEARRPEPEIAKSGKSKRGSRAAQPAWYRRPQAQLALSAGLFLVGGLAVWMGLDEPRKGLAEIDYYVGHGNYARALSVAPKLTRSQLDVSSELRLQFALYHTGRLGDDLFSNRNQTSWDPLPGLGGGLDTCRAQSRILLELGLVSEAEHMAHEALETEGERPELLRTLAEVNILKHRPAAARVFLNVLAEVPFWNGMAQEWLSGLKTDPLLLNNPEVTGIRRLMLTNDLAHQAFPAEGMLVQLLRCNPTNQMAFEYLMSEYLVNLQVDKVANRLWELDSLKYGAIPRHYEEALLLYEQGSGSQIELRGRAIRPETAERFRQFNQAMNQHQFSNEAGRRELAEHYGDTYWYYYFARRNQPPQS